MKEERMVERDLEGTRLMYIVMYLVSLCTRVPR